MESAGRPRRSGEMWMACGFRAATQAKGKAESPPMRRFKSLGQKNSDCAVAHSIVAWTVEQKA
jgi:hypothetical protein